MPAEREAHSCPSCDDAPLQHKYTITRKAHMNNDTPADAITVIQADRDLVYSLFWFGAKTELEKRALEYIRDGKGDDARAVQEVARHRTTSLAAQDGLVDALRNYLEAEEIDDPVIRMQELSVCREAALAALASIEVKSS